MIHIQMVDLRHLPFLPVLGFPKAYDYNAVALSSRL